MLRGEIYNPDRARQLRDFSGLVFGNITPTDIDGLIEYKNIGYVILELKYQDGDVPFGQKLALERLTDDLEKVGKQTLCIIAIHKTDDCNIAIDTANTIVAAYRYHGKWNLGNPELSTGDLVTRFLNFISA